MSSATTAAPMSLSRAIRLPMRSRRQGHCPIADKLRSSTSMMTMRSAGGFVRADRSRMSYAALSRRAKNVGGKTAIAAETRTAVTPHRNTRRRRGVRAFGDLATAVRLPHEDVDATIAGLRSLIWRLDQRIELAD